jgi:hypothetical protein
MFRTTAAIIFVFGAVASADAASDQLPPNFIGWYAPLNASADHCIKPETWDDNYTVTARFVRFTDGQGNFTSITTAPNNTATLQLTYKEETRTIKQTEIYHLENAAGKVLLIRTITAVRSSPPSRQGARGLPAVLPVMQKCP